MDDRWEYGVAAERGNRGRAIGTGKAPWLLAVSGALALAAGSAAAEPVTILALGDSLTAGYGLPPEEGFVPQLQDWLDAQGAEITVVNAGVSGDTTTGGLARLDWSLTPEVDAMIVALGGNDYLRGIDPSASRAALEEIIETAEARDVEVLLVGITAGTNYGPDYQSAFNAVYTDLAQAHDLPLRPDFFEGLRPARDAGALRDMLQADGLHPNAAGVALIVADLGPAVLALAEEAAD